MFWEQATYIYTIKHIPVPPKALIELNSTEQESTVRCLDLSVKTQMHLGQHSSSRLWGKQFSRAQDKDFKIAIMNMFKNPKGICLNTFMKTVKTWWNEITKIIQDSSRI